MYTKTHQIFPAMSLWPWCLAPTFLPIHSDIQLRVAFLTRGLLGVLRVCHAYLRYYDEVRRHKRNVDWVFEFGFGGCFTRVSRENAHLFDLGWARCGMDSLCSDPSRQLGAHGLLKNRRGNYCTNVEAWNYFTRESYQLLRLNMGNVFLSTDQEVRPRGLRATT